MVPELKTFIAVAQYGTFSAAADRVGLTQAAVSGHIKRLEERLGFLLFDRTGHSARLNDNGYRILTRAKTIVRLVDTLGDLEDQAPGRDLRVGAIASARATMLGQALDLFAKRYGQQRVEIIPDVSLHLLDQVDTGEIDLAILVKPPFSLPTETRWTTLTRDPYVLVVGDNCQDDDWRQALQSQPFLRYDKLSFAGRQVDRFLRSLPFAIHEARELAAQAMLEAVVAGEGAALIPLRDHDGPLPRGARMLPLHGKSLFKEVGVITARESMVEPAVNHLRDCIVETFRG